MKIKTKGNPPPYVTEYVDFQLHMPHIAVGKIPEGMDKGKVTITLMSLNAFIAAFLNEIWDNQEKYLPIMGRGADHLSDEDKLQMIWNSMAALMESVSLQFGFEPNPGSTPLKVVN